MNEQPLRNLEESSERFFVVIYLSAFLVLFPKNFHIQVYHNFMEKEKNDCKGEERNKKDPAFYII